MGTVRQTELNHLIIYNCCLSQQNPHSHPHSAVEGRAWKYEIYSLENGDKKFYLCKLFAIIAKQIECSFFFGRCILCIRYIEMHRKNVEIFCN